MAEKGSEEERGEPVCSRIEVGGRRHSPHTIERTKKEPGNRFDQNWSRNETMAGS